MARVSLCLSYTLLHLQRDLNRAVSAMRRGPYQHQHATHTTETPMLSSLVWKNHSKQTERTRLHHQTRDRQAPRRPEGLML
jgi:hypothetical protein